MTAQYHKICLMIFLISIAAFSGCIGNEKSDEEVIRIAFSVKDDYTSFSENPQKLADYLSTEIGVEVEIYPITSDALALQALRFGSADIAFMDGGAGWVGWKMYDLEVMAADQKSDGRTYYNAHAWVLNGSEAEIALNDGNDSTDPFAVLEGQTSCHTGWLKSAGMLIPMGYLIGQEYAEVVGDDDDIESLRNTIFNYFSEDASIPESGTPYYGYSGALKCLSEGVGDVAFAKDSTIETYCGDENPSENEDWCLTRENYVTLPAFGQAPSHPLMYQPNTLDNSTRDAIVSALVNLSYSGEGQDMLSSILNTPGIVATNAEAHLGAYSSLISSVPGISTYYDEKYTATS